MSLFAKPELITLNNLELTNNDLFIRKEVKNPSKKTMVVVNDTHNAIFIKDGAYLNTLSAGKHSVLEKGDKDVDSVEFIYVSKTCKVEVKWGTPNRFDMRDPQTDIPIKIGVRGTFEVQIGDPRKAYLELIGADKTYTTAKLQERLRSRMCSEIQPIIAKVMRERNLTYDRITQNTKEIADLIKPAMANMFNKDYGLTLFSFVIDAIMIDEEDIRKIEEELLRRKDELKQDALKAKEEEERRREFDEQIRKEYELLKLNKAADDIAFERQKWLEELRANNYEKYLRAVEIVGWPNGQPTGKDSSGARGAHYCPKCGHSYENGAKFCPGCGSKVGDEPSVCPSCGKPVTAGSTFCPNCGKKL